MSSSSSDAVSLWSLTATGLFCTSPVKFYIQGMKVICRVYVYSPGTDAGHLPGLCHLLLINQGIFCEFKVEITKGAATWWEGGFAEARVKCGVCKHQGCTEGEYLSDSPEAKSVSHTHISTWLVLAGTPEFLLPALHQVYIRHSSFLGWQVQSHCTYKETKVCRKSTGEEAAAQEISLDPMQPPPSIQGRPHPLSHPVKRLRSCHLLCPMLLFLLVLENSPTDWQVAWERWPTKVWMFYFPFCGILLSHCLRNLESDLFFFF